MDQADVKDRPAPCCCHTEHFTQREVNVLCQVAAGLTNDEVAAALRISGHTVAGHLREMLTRSNVRSRAELVAWAYAVGVLAPYMWPPRWSGRRCLQLPAWPTILCRFRTWILALSWAFAAGSRGALVLVDQTAQDGPAQDRRTGVRPRHRCPRMRRLLVQGLVRPVGVVVLDVLLQHDGQVSPAGNQEPGRCTLVLATESLGLLIRIASATSLRSLFS